VVRSRGVLLSPGRLEFDPVAEGVANVDGGSDTRRPERIEFVLHVDAVVGEALFDGLDVLVDPDGDVVVSSECKSSLT
jgi:hypothetical protein